MITETFARLLVIKIVANKRSVSSNNPATRISDSRLLSSTSFKSLCDKEEKAASEAEAKPDTNKKMPAQSKATTADAEGAVTEALPNQSATTAK